MGFLARLLARFAPTSVRALPEAQAFLEAVPTTNLLPAVRVSANLLWAPTVGHRTLPPPFAPTAVAVVNLVVTVRLVPLDRFDGRLRVSPEIAAQLQPVVTELEPPNELLEGVPESQLLPFEELFFRELGRCTQLDVATTNRLLGEVAALGAIVEVSNGRRTRRERRFNSAQEEMNYQQLRNRLILGHWRLCLQWVREGEWAQRCQSMTEPDLFNEAVFGLARAIELFEPERDTALGTYAFQWVRQALGRSRAATDRFIRLPIHCLQRSTLSRSEYLRLTYILSLSEPDAVGAELLPDPRDTNNLEAIRGADFAHTPDAALESALQSLTKREADVLRRRFGLNSGPEETLKEIGQTYGISRERVRQIEVTALKKLTNGVGRRLLASVAPD